MQSIKAFEKNRHEWITCLESDFYPDYLEAAVEFYEPIIEKFGELLHNSSSSIELFRNINRESPDIRVQLQRIFRKYLSPNTSVEMLKVKQKENEIIKNFGKQFRPIKEARKLFSLRPSPDEALAAILHEYKTRGQKGYELTDAFFTWFRTKFSKEFIIEGPERAGPDIPLSTVFSDYPTLTTVDFVIYSLKKVPLVLGYARYDSDRGGSQGLDRINSYSDKVTEILNYAQKKKLSLKMLFINDGPGLLLGRLWERYAALENKGGKRVVVATLKMLDQRVTKVWINS